jgi:hypothetical protein
MKRVRAIELNVKNTIGGWNKKHWSHVWDEDVYLIGMSFHACTSGTAQGVVLRLTKGVTDVLTDTEMEDTYFAVGGTVGSAAGHYAGSGGQSFMLPEGYYFPVNEDEPIFLDVFTDLDDQGGHMVLYYVLKREWKK